MDVPPSIPSDRRCSAQVPHPHELATTTNLVSLPEANSSLWSSHRQQLRPQHLCENCGKQYSAQHHLENHQRSCNASKRKLSDLLSNTKEFWEARKKRRVAEVQPTETREPDRGPESRINLNTASKSQRRSVQGSQTEGSMPSSRADSEKSSDLDSPVATRRTRREKRLPARYIQEDILPRALPSVDVAPADEVIPEAVSSGPTVTDTSPRILVPHPSRRNMFGIERTYRILQGSTLTHDPEQAVTLRALTDSTSAATDPSINLGQWGPFSNESTFALADWYWHSKNKSFNDFQKLISILKQPSFHPADIVNFNWKAAFKALGANREDLADHEGAWIQDDGWKTTPVTIDVPFHKRMLNPGFDAYAAGNFHHRSLVSVIKEKISRAKDSRSFHYQPYRATWKPTDEAPEVELYGELYASRAFREAHEEVQALPTTDRNQGLERVVVAMMFWSDATQLTSFGGASLWPCYLFFGNESKYRRCQPSEGLGEQVAYFIKLSDTFNDYLRKRNNGKLPTDGLFAHCAREIFQKQWEIMLDDELMEAMKHGLVLLCPDGIRRCFYPRIFTYSADYPEKILVAGLRNNGGRPCHRCLVAKSDLYKLAAITDTEREECKRSEEDQREKVDLARGEIQAGFAVDGSRIDLHLKSDSLVPVHNAFSRRLAQISFKILPALVVDLMHEFEIGAWKRLFIHLIRLLEAFSSLERKGATFTADLDIRYRKTPAFGRDTIRKFGENASEMKRRAARDYEDLLQCAIPAFESLLPEPHNSMLLKLLYICAQWHALAKLRMHHDKTLQLLDYTTTWLGAQIRLFNRDTCSKITTKELQKESEARERREGKGKGSNTRKLVKFNIFTIKFHFLGDYVPNIRLFGTTDSFSTETGELFHRLPKSWFERTDRRNYAAQLSQIERRQARLDQIRESNDGREGLQGDPAQFNQPPRELGIEDSPDLRYVIGATENSPVELTSICQNPDMPHDDPFLVNFIPKLKRHLLPRIVSRLGFTSNAFREEDWINVAFHRLYSHKLMRINYTAYDVRRSQDIIHIGTPQSNVMLLNEASTNASDPDYASVHPYLYAKVLGIYHANVSYVGTLPDGTRNLTSHRIEFVWAHWYDIVEFGEEFTLDRLALHPVSFDEALDFLDPSDIIRGVHLIPRFALFGPPPLIFVTKRSKLVAASEDVWIEYYINKFADRDLFMRYQYGMAVGHTYMRKMHPSRMTIPLIPADFDYYIFEADSPNDATEEGDGVYVDPPSDDSEDEGLECVD